MQFGHELEFYGASLKEMSIKYHIPYINRKEQCNYENFTLKDEVAITDNQCGGELISPIYKDKEICLKELKEKLIMLKENNAYLKKDAENTGFHIHLDKRIFKDDEYRKQMFLKFFVAFQSDIYEKAKGEFKMGGGYADHLRKTTTDHMLKNEEYRNRLLFQKDYGIRLTEKTLELRMFNSSLNYEVLKEYIEFSLQLGMFIEKGIFDEELINYYYNKFSGLEDINEERKIIMENMLR